MSLATAQRALAKANRDTLQKTASGKIASGIMEGLAEAGETAVGMADSLGITKNMNAWEDFEAGQEYLNMESTGPKKMSQRLFSNPNEVYSESMKDLGRNKTFSADEISSVGSLARSDLKAAYEGYMDGDLSSTFGSKTNAINVESSDIGNTGLFNYDDTLSQRARKDSFNNKVEVKDESGTGITINKEGILKGKGLTATSSLDRKYTSLEKPEYGDNSLAPIADENQFQIGSTSGNLKAEKFLRDELGMKGKGLSNMIPGWTSMDETEKLDKLQKLGYSPGQEPSLSERFQKDLNDTTSSLNNKKNKY
jgi:hypothetical protein